MTGRSKGGPRWSGSSAGCRPACGSSGGRYRSGLIGVVAARGLFRPGSAGGDVRSGWKERCIVPLMLVVGALVSSAGCDGRPGAAQGAADPVRSPKSKQRYATIPDQVLFRTDQDGKAVVAGDLTNVKQGRAGDCYFLAALLAVANRAQDVIKALVHDNGDGTYSGTFHGLLRGRRGTFKATVDGTLPVKGNGRVANNAVEIVDGRAVAWAAVIEKLWAAVNGNSYSRINGIGNDSAKKDHDIQNGLYAITGKIPMGRKPASLTFAQLQQDLRQGAVVIGTGHKSGVLAARHSLAILDADATRETMTIRDPKGGTRTIGFKELINSNVNQYFTVPLPKS